MTINEGVHDIYSDGFLHDIALLTLFRAYFTITTVFGILLDTKEVSEKQ